MKSKENIVIVGGGIAGLLSAYLLSEDQEYNIHLIEKTDELGGLFRCFDYGKYGKFDYGAHNILETGIEELDNILTSILPEDKWQISSTTNGQRRTLTGAYFNGKLQKHSPFPDLRSIKNIDELRLDFLSHMEKDIEIKFTNAFEYSKTLFGKKITKQIISPLLKSLYGQNAKDLDYMVLILTPLGRVGLFDKIISDELLKTDKISTRLSYPDQESLPREYVKAHKAYYPKDYGIYRIINSLENTLRERSISIHLEEEVERIILKENNVDQIKLKTKQIKNVKHIFWSAGLNSLKNSLNIKVENLKFQPNPKTVITNILIDKKLKVGDISYFYNHDTNKYKTFRIDNYINYCSGAKREGLYPISIERLASNEDIQDLDTITNTAINELKSFNILKKNTKIKFVKTEVLDNGFPLLSNDNVNSIHKIRKTILGKKIKGLTAIGILAEKGLFFEGDVKIDLYKKIKRFLSENSNHATNI